jgi:hypothetical protein
MIAEGYWIVVLGPDDKAMGRAQISCDNDHEAAVMAFCTSSPFGHELWSERGFLGRFETALSIEKDPDA